MNAKVVYAKCLAAQQQYHEAKEAAYDIIQVSGDNPMLQGQMADLMKVWNEKLIEQREARYADSVFFIAQDAVYDRSLPCFLARRRWYA